MPCRLPHVSSNLSVSQTLRVVIVILGHHQFQIKFWWMNSNRPLSSVLVFASAYFPDCEYARCTCLIFLSICLVFALSICFPGVNTLDVLVWSQRAWPGIWFELQPTSFLLLPPQTHNCRNCLTLIFLIFLNRLPSRFSEMHIAHNNVGKDWT